MQSKDVEETMKTMTRVISCAAVAACVLATAAAEAAQSTFAIAVLGGNSSACYRFNESSGLSAYDSSGNGNDAEYEGSMSLP